MSDEITITRKYVIYPIASDMKEWERKVRKYVSENYEKRIQLLEQKIKHSKIPKEEKENLRKELDNLKIKYDAFQADPVITQSEINTYTYGTVRTAMEEEARKKNYILSWIYSEMIGAGVQHMETLKEKYQFISNRMNYAYRLPGNKNGSLFDEAEIHNILKGYGFAFSQMLTSKIKDCVKKGLLEGKVSLPNYKIDSPFTVAKACMGFSHDYDNFEELCEHIHDSDLKLYFDYGGNKKPSIAKFKIDLGKGKNREELAATLLKVYSGEYEYCGSSIQISKKKIILNLSMKIPKIPTELDENTVVGVNLGVKRNGKPTKACLGIRTKNGASYDVVIMGLKENQPDINNCTKEELTEALDGRIYTTLRFCNIEALDTMIKLLQDTKKMWEADIHNRK